MTWRQQVDSLKTRLGRTPELHELIELSKGYTMTDEEKAEQARSYARGMSARCEHGVLDFEQCGICRKWI